jgi:transposase InsO family protein
VKPKNLVIVRAVREQGLSHAEAAARFGVTRQWVHTLVRRYDAEGPDGVAPRSRAPQTRPGRTPPAVRTRIIDLRHDLTRTGADAGPATIAWHLEREGYRTPSTATIRRILHAEGLITPAPSKRPRSSYIRFEADLPNECWQADITHWYLSSGTRIEILDFLDDHARFLLEIGTAAAFTGPMVVTVMTELINRYGPPMSTLTDNGLVFTTRLARHKGARGGFEKLLAAHGITQKNGRPGHPQTQGKIERFHQTLKRFLAARPLPDTIDDLQSMLTEFQTWYNTQRPHRSTGRKTRSRPTPRSPKPPRPAQHAQNGAPAQTRSTRTGKSPSATPGNSDTSGSAKPTPARPCFSLSTTATSPPATRTPGKSSPSTPSTPPATTSRRNREPPRQR